METNIQQTNQEKKNKASTWEEEIRKVFRIIGKLIQISVIGLIAFSLLFHWMPDHDNRVFLKESLSWNNTIITDYDVDKLIERHNETGGIERALLRNEYIYKKLVENGIIVSKSDDF